MFLPYRIEYDDLDLDAPSKPLFTWALLVINMALFALCQSVPAKELLLLFHRFGFVPEEPSATTGLTYMFLHANWLHVLGNMYFLWLYGRALEAALGSLKFLALYLSAGAVAILTHLAFVPPELADIPCIGASGAISGILGGFLALLPGVSVECVLLFGIRPVILRTKAVFVLAIWFLLQLFEQWAGQTQNASTVAYGAHIGGFLFGCAAIGLMRIARRAASDWQGLLREAEAKARGGVAGKG
jgi:membrane associated rhomboid family serine protease